jgi:hypothetical protein
MVNLMRWRLEKVLGYGETLALSIHNTNGQDLYDMIFATDHAAGERIMAHLYRRSPAQQRVMRQHALLLRRDRKRSERGEDALFDVESNMVVPLDGGYVSEIVNQPPHPPYRLLS